LSGAYDENYNYRLLSSASPYYTIQITPKDVRKNFKKIILYVHQKKNLVTKATVTDKRDNRFQFVFSSLQTHLSIPDAQFVFNEKEHPGVEVIKQ
jgi:outer membrane lipoprotein-sorting protein